MKNHIVGLPKKDDLDRPFYDYQRMIFQWLATPGNNTNSHGKHQWIKKASSSSASVSIVQGSSSPTISKPYDPLYSVSLVSVLDTILKHAYEILQDSDDNRGISRYGIE